MLCMLHAARRIVAMQNASKTLLKPTCCACVCVLIHAARARRLGMSKARASAGGMWGAHLQAREPRGSGLLEVVFMLASTLPRLPAARKPLNPCGIHPKRAGWLGRLAWDASRPWCGGLRPMPQPTVERLEPGARALRKVNTNEYKFSSIF